MIPSPYVHLDDHQMNLSSLVIFIFMSPHTVFVMISKDIFL